jgi:glycosyltransferase involved in cell wall biosynthesis
MSFAPASSRVSIILAAYNAEKFVATMLASVLAQTHEDFEVIVVDDGSSDKTSGVVESCGDARVRLVRQENKGQSAALNKGAALSTGDFIKFIDADDWLNPTHIESQVAALRGSSDTLASCRWGYFVDNPATPRLVPEKTNRDYADPFEWLVDSLSLDEGMMGLWLWLIPRTLFDRSGGWDERMTYDNDFEFTIRLLLASSAVRYAAGAVYSYREGVEGAVSARRDLRSMESAVNTTASACANLLGHEDSPRIRKICADRWQRWAHQLYPDYPPLAARAENEAAKLGGSSLKLEGGALLRALLPFVGWKAIRRLQVTAYRSGWSRVLKWKARRRLDAIKAGSV